MDSPSASPRLLLPEERTSLHSQLDGWVIAEHLLTKTFEFADFLSAVSFINVVAKVAEELNHHPDIHLHEYKKLTFNVMTHLVGGVTTADVNLAKEIETLFENFEVSSLS